MYILGNAIKNIGRNKGRNLLLAVIIFAIILTTAISIIINTTTAAIIADYKDRFGSQVFIILDREKAKSVDLGDFADPTLEQLLQFGESDLLQSKEYRGTNTLNMTNIKGLDEDKMQGMGGDVAQEGQAQEGYKSPNAILIGNSRPDIDDEFKNGLREIIDGTMPQKAGEVLISEALAKLNGLSVGATIQIKNIDYSFFLGEKESKPITATLTVSGIYSDNTPEDPDKQYTMAITNRSNELITTLDIFQGLPINQTENGMSSYSATFYLKDPSQLGAFQEELYAKGLSKYFKVTTDEASYNKVVGPVEGLAKISNVFLIVVLALGGIILILLSALSIRERKYEIGVLRAMGMKKGKVALGLLTEMIAITAMCLVVGLGAGILAAQPVSNMLLSSQVAAAENKGFGGEDDRSYGVQNSTGQQPLSELKINLSAAAVGEISLIALLLAGISSIAGIVYITRYEPMKILSERN